MEPKICVKIGTANILSKSAKYLHRTTHRSKQWSITGLVSQGRRHQNPPWDSGHGAGDRDVEGFRVGIVLERSVHVLKVLEDPLLAKFWLDRGVPEEQGCRKSVTQHRVTGYGGEGKTRGRLYLQVCMKSIFINHLFMSNSIHFMLVS